MVNHIAKSGCPHRNLRAVLAVEKSTLRTYCIMFPLASLQELMHVKEHAIIYGDDYPLAISHSFNPSIFYHTKRGTYRCLVLLGRG